MFAIMAGLSMSTSQRLTNLHSQVQCIMSLNANAPEFFFHYKMAAVAQFNLGCLYYALASCHPGSHILAQWIDVAFRLWHPCHERTTLRGKPSTGHSGMGFAWRRHRLCANPAYPGSSTGGRVMYKLGWVGQTELLPVWLTTRLGPKMHPNQPNSTC